MANVIIAALFGVIVGFLFARYILIAPGSGERTFADYLKKFGLVGGTGVLTISLQIAGIFAFKKEAITEGCLLAYFLAFVVTAIFAFVLICWLLCRSVSSKSVPPSILNSERSNLLVTLLLGGYPDVKDHLEAVRALTRVSVKTTANPEQLHKQLYGDDQQTKEQLAEECEVGVKGLDLIREYLKLSQDELKQFCKTVRRHHGINS